MKYPANAEVYLLELKKLIDFETASPDGIVQLVDPDSSFEEVVNNLLNSTGSL